MHLCGVLTTAEKTIEAKEKKSKHHSTPKYTANAIGSKRTKLK